MGRRKLPELVGIRASYRAIEAALTASLANDVPQGDPSRRQPRQPILIRDVGQILSDSVAEKTPELILRMSIIALGLERCLAGQATQDQQPGIRRAHWSHGTLDDDWCLQRLQQALACR